MRHAGLDKLCTLVGGFYGANGKKGKTITGNHWPDKVGRRDQTHGHHVGDVLSSYLLMPRVGHLEQSLHIFGYLKVHLKRKLYFYLSHPIINENRFQQCDWMVFYRESEEVIPRNVPVARGKFMSMNCFVDANNAGDTGTR